MKKTIIGSAILFSAGMTACLNGIQVYANEVGAEIEETSMAIAGNTENQDQLDYKNDLVIDSSADSNSKENLTESADINLGQTESEMDLAEEKFEDLSSSDKIESDIDSTEEKSEDCSPSDQIVSDMDFTEDKFLDSSEKGTLEDIEKPQQETTQITEGAASPVVLTKNDVVDGWNDSKTSYYINGTKVTGQKQIDGYWYCFDENGNKITGLYTLSAALNNGTAKTVFYNELGQMVYGEANVDGKGDWRYFSSVDGSMKISSFLSLSSSISNNNLAAVYYYLSSGKKAKGQKNLDGYWYCFDLQTGAMKKGFTTLTTDYQPDGAKVVYYDGNGRMLYGQQKIGSDWYCFDLASGKMFTGLTSLSKAYEPTGAKTVLYNSSGKMLFNAQSWKGHNMFFNSRTGAMISSQFVKTNGKTYYYGKDGYQVSGQKLINGHWRFFDPDNGNAMAVSRFVNLSLAMEPSGAKTVYYDSNGYMLHGQQRINNNWYCFDLSTGKMFTGLTSLSSQYEKSGAKTVYYNNKGQMQFGLQTVNSKKMYFNSATGALYKNKMATINNITYYFDSNGYQSTGQKNLNGKWYYFDPNNDGAMVKGKFFYLDKTIQPDDPKTVYYGSDGAMIFGQKHIGENWYCFDLSSGKMFTGLKKLNTSYEPSGAKTVYYDSSGKMQYGLVKVNGKSMYFDTSTGALKTNTIVTVDGVRYQADANGYLSEITNNILHGIDISHWQDGIDLTKITADFIILKASGGKSFTDASFSSFASTVVNTGRLLGMYHFARDNGYEGTAQQEATHFYNTVKNYIGIGIPILDWEASAISLGVEWAKNFLDTFYSLSGVRPLIYMSASVTREYDWSSVANAGYGLWLAQYANNDPVYGYDDDPLTDSKGTGAFGTVIMHQYTSCGRLDGYNGNLDLDIFYGNESFWKSLAAKVR